MTSTISEQRFSGDMKVINRSVFDLFRYLFFSYSLLAAANVRVFPVNREKTIPYV